jgi:hypothetical protein
VFTGPCAVRSDPTVGSEATAPRIDKSAEPSPLGDNPEPRPSGIPTKWVGRGASRGACWVALQPRALPPLPNRLTLLDPRRPGLTSIFDGLFSCERMLEEVAGVPVNE